MSAGLAIAGRLVGPDGEPVTRCYISVDPAPDGGATTSADVECDAHGRFTAGGLSAGTYTLSTWHYVSSDQRDKQRKYAHQVFGPFAAGSKDVVIVLQLESTLHGRVLDRNGAPVPQATVIAKSARKDFESTRVRADAAGRFEIELPADLDVEVIAGPAQPDESAEPDASRCSRAAKTRAGGEAITLRLP
jgi:hypothetical protein